MDKIMKYSGIIVANELFYYTFAENLNKLIFSIHFNTYHYVLDIGISIQVGRCSLAGNQG